MRDVDPETVRSFEQRVLLSVLRVEWSANLAAWILRGEPGPLRKVRGVRAVERFHEEPRESEELMWRTVAEEAVGYLFHAEP